MPKAAASPISRREARPRAPRRTLALVFALVGFGIKAGAVPLHFWLPGAHAAAPSHVSAVLSGVMLKMGIYGLLRVLTLLGSPPAWFGWTLFGLGTGVGGAGRAVGAGPARPQAAARVPQRREHRHHPARHGRGSPGDGLWPPGGGAAGVHGGAAAHAEPRAVQEPAVPGRGGGGAGDGHAGDRPAGRPGAPDAADGGGIRRSAPSRSWDCRRSTAS